MIQTCIITVWFLRTYLSLHIFLSTSCYLYKILKIIVFISLQLPLVYFLQLLVAIASPSKEIEPHARRYHFRCIRLRMS